MSATRATVSAAKSVRVVAAPPNQALQRAAFGIKCSAAGGRAPRAHERWRARVLKRHARSLNLVVRRLFSRQNSNSLGRACREVPRSFAEGLALRPRRSNRHRHRHCLKRPAAQRGTVVPAMPAGQVSDLP
jgi:hypothetical protein